jgi:hypothetical protein
MSRVDQEASNAQGESSGLHSPMIPSRDRLEMHVTSRHVSSPPMRLQMDGTGYVDVCGCMPGTARCYVLGARSPLEPSSSMGAITPQHGRRRCEALRGTARHCEAHLLASLGVPSIRPLTAVIGPLIKMLVPFQHSTTAPRQTCTAHCITTRPLDKTLLGTVLGSCESWLVAQTGRPGAQSGYDVGFSRTGVKAVFGLSALRLLQS